MTFSVSRARRDGTVPFVMGNEVGMVGMRWTTLNDELIENGTFDSPTP